MTEPARKRVRGKRIVTDRPSVSAYEREIRKRMLAQGRCPQCCKPNDSKSKVCLECRTKLRVKDLSLRLDVIKGYGGRCVTCAEGDAEVLELDHIRTDGKAHRLELGTGSNILRWAKLNGFPPSLQLLCANCHRRKTLREKARGLSVDEKYRRIDWDNYFMALASAAAKRSTCPRLMVGAVLAKDRQLITSGYNGNLPGQPHCLEVGCLMVAGSCQSSCHAEENAVFQAMRLNKATEGATLYVTHAPCQKCFRFVVGAGVVHIWYALDYKTPDYRGISPKVQCLRLAP